MTRVCFAFLLPLYVFAFFAFLVTPNSLEGRPTRSLTPSLRRNDCQCGCAHLHDSVYLHGCVHVHELHVRCNPPGTALSPYPFLFLFRTHVTVSLVCFLHTWMRVCLLPLHLCARARVCLLLCACFCIRVYACVCVCVSACACMCVCLCLSVQYG